MRIQFINPPFLGRFSRAQRSPGVIRSGTMYYPYWLAHAAAYAEQQGYEIDLVDCPAAGIDETAVLGRIGSFSPDLVVLESVTASWEADCRSAVRIKQTVPRARLCMAGTHVTAEWKQTLAFEAVDLVAIGEYDITIADAARTLQQGGSFGDVPGLAFRRGSEPVRTPERPLIHDLDALPWIAPIYKRFLDPQQYYFNLSAHPMLMLIGGRGCTSMCFYCVYPQVMHGHRYRHRSARHIVDEMRWIQDQMPEIKEITFEDDNFGADPAFARQFAALVREQGVSLPFFANLRSTIDFDTLRALKNAGLHSCAVGFESGSDLILQNMRKGQNRSHQKRFMHYARELGVLVHGCFMVGFPGETRQSMHKTLALALELKPDSAQFYPVMPYPGTGAYDYYRQAGYIAATSFRDWLDAAGQHRCVINLPGLDPDEIQAFCDRAYTRFHFRPRYLVYKAWQALRNPAEGVRSLQAGFHFLASLLRRKKPQPSRTYARPTLPANWGSRIRPPKGRMETVKKIKDRT